VRITYNAPVVLTYAIVCAVIKALDLFTGGTLISAFFAVPGSGHFDWTEWTNYFRLFSYVFGHVDWLHLAGNFYLILLIGPILEEKYGSGRLLVMMIITTLVTGLLNAFLFPEGLTGASGIAFMLILLTPFTSTKPGEIPLTFILIAALYLSQELLSATRQDSISQFAHIAGGITGSVFGFLGLSGRSGTGASTPQAKTAKTAEDWLRELDS